MICAACPSEAYVLVLGHPLCARCHVEFTELLETWISERRMKFETSRPTQEKRT